MRLTHLPKIAAIAGVIAAPLAMSGPAANAATGAPSSAYGIAATGVLPIPQTPAVSSSAQQPTRKSLLELPANPVVKASILSASASAGHARASVVDLKVAQLGLSAHLITAKCVNGAGTSNLVKVVLNGHVLKVAAAPNSAVKLPLTKLGGTASVVINKQVRDSSGRLTVTALEVSAPLGPGKFEKISIASAACAGYEATPPAPAPTPVPGDLPVTG
ncbi:MAG: hypothetical protein JWO67_2452 [Streptosporangiaceae bacterium]|nr:hypothetical protein [Streptosporangiaceae bacterium]